RTALHDLYGLTETGSCDFHAQPAGEGADAADAGTIGRPTAGVTFRITGPDGGAVPAGEAGELRIRTPYGMLGYLDDPALTASALDDGHFRTGDLARAGPDGRVILVGRLTDIVSRGGNKIAPQEIDDLLATHPDIAAALCAGVPDARLGEALHAVVVPRPGAVLTAGAVRAWAAARIERFKLPDVITIAQALPVGPTGKASRALLREHALAGAQARAAAGIDG
ncbi:class I adenylate-forming enzyme family protein, partial [Acidisphaera rubrifaciens]|uniref:class I adenylate-forming enzyme family protein n=1 Tax=Acidisphaera rubrifaciens TaxID=50715 RepID=UPI0006622747